MIQGGSAVGQFNTTHLIKHLKRHKKDNINNISIGFFFFND